MAEYALNCEYDGLIISDFSGDPILTPGGINETLYVAFDPAQIKTAIGFWELAEMEAEAFVERVPSGTQSPTMRG